MKKTFTSIASFLLLFTLSVSQLCGETNITILHTNDTHSHLMPFDSKEYGPDSGGIVRRSGLIKSIRNQLGNVLLLDAGDILQGTPFYIIFKGEACYKTAAECGYDATTLGNHELDNSLENLKTQLTNSGMRLLCCNVFYRDTGRHVFQPYMVFVRNGVKIGVIGSIGNAAWDEIDCKIRAPMINVDQTTSVREVARRIRPYVDLVVVLSHAGIEFDEQMAARVAEIDLLIGGHTHVELAAPRLVKNLPEAGKANNGLDGTLVVQAGEHGQFLGRVNLTLDDSGKIATWSGCLEQVSTAHESLAPAGIRETVESFNRRLEDMMNEVVGYTEKALDYPRDLRKTAMLPMGTFTAKSMLEAAKSDMCVINSGVIRNDIKAGNITCGGVFEALPYDNTVVSFKMSGEKIQKMLDHICSHLGDPDGYQFAGVEATFNTSTGKAENVKIAAAPIDLRKEYRVSTSSFMANGNVAGDILFAGAGEIEDSNIIMRDAAINLARELKTLPDMSVAPISIKGSK